MLLRYPYYAPYLSPRRWRERQSVGTMAVTVRQGAAQFFYSPAFVCNCTDLQLEAVIHHEVLHVIFGHPELDVALYPNERALMAAEEVTVNEHVPEPLPGDPLTLSDFPELPAGEDTITRYHRLENRDDLADRVRTLDMHGVWNPAPNQKPGAELDALQQALVSQLLRSKDRAALHWAISGLGDHDGRGLINDLRDPTASQTPIRWEKLLAGTAGQRARQEPNLLRPPRRMPERIGVIPGTSLRPEKPRVLAAIDTSSSMKRKHFERIRFELDQLRKISDVTVVQCDKRIRKTFALRGPLQTISGRGGTDLRPPLAADFLCRHRPDVVIYFTDGDGPAPPCQPKVPVIWCLTSGSKLPARWGRVVRFEPSATKAA